MGYIKNRLLKMPMRKAFITMVFTMAILVGILSSSVIAVCLNVNNRLLSSVEVIRPSDKYNTNDDENADDDTHRIIIAEDKDIQIGKNGEIIALSMEYRIENLSPKNKVLYYVMKGSIVLFPFLFVMIGIVLCAYLFYRIKIDKPLSVLMSSAQKIADNDLDCKVDYHAPDEMGTLCNAFEQMRATLLESNRKIRMIMEERRKLNASISHDLRTPITIIEGYTEYLQLNIPKGKIDEDKLMVTLSNLSESANRLERYVDSVRDIQSLDEMELKKENVSLRSTIVEMSEDLRILSDKASKDLNTSFDIPDILVLMDRQVFYRILENTVSNALRYAKNTVLMTFTLEHDDLTAAVSDDGQGFSDHALLSALTPLYKEGDNSGHMGLGLAICDILCKKHGGWMSLSNNSSGGAAVKIAIKIQKNEFLD